MFTLLWDVEEFKVLSNEGHSIHHDLLVCIDCCNLELFKQYNVPWKLSTVRKQLLDFIIRIVHFQRTSITHIFVFMLSSDIHDRKPHAIPVQCVPCASLKEVRIHRLITSLCKLMNSYGMKVADIMTVNNITFYC